MMGAMNKRFYVTTAIDYVNGQPHLGHAYEKVIADVIARARRSLGQEVFFLTGLDEHGQKVQQAAQAEGKSPQAYCDALAATWQKFVRKLGLSNDDFVRTTQPRHKAVVQAILSRLHAEGQFYKKKHKGFYSTTAETFLTEKDRLPDGTFDPGYGKVVELEEENYYFNLRQHQAWLIEHIDRQSRFHRARIAAQRGAGLFEEQRIGRPLHQPSGRPAQLGHSHSFRHRFCHLRLVRRAGQLHQRSLRPRRSGRGRRRCPRPIAPSGALRWNFGPPTCMSSARTFSNFTLSFGRSCSKR